MKILKISKVLKSASLGISPGHAMGWKAGDPPLKDEDFDKFEAHQQERLQRNRDNFKKHKETCPVCSKYDTNKELCQKGHQISLGKSAKNTAYIKLSKTK